MRDPGRQLLECDVDDRVEQALREQIGSNLAVLARAEAAVHHLDAQLLQFERVDRPGHYQVVAQRDAVAVLLGSPPVDPVAPGSVHAEVHRDLAVIRRQVVLGHQVLHHRHLGDVGQLGLAGLPVLPAERVVVFAV